MQRPKLYIWCSPSIPRWLFHKSKTRPPPPPQLSYSLFNIQPLKIHCVSFTCMCGPKSALGPLESWHDGQSYISTNDDRISLGKIWLFWTRLSSLIKRPRSQMQIGAVEMALKPGVTGADKPQLLWLTYRSQSLLMWVMWIPQTACMQSRPLNSLATQSLFNPGSDAAGLATRSTADLFHFNISGAKQPLIYKLLIWWRRSKGCVWMKTACCSLYHTHTYTINNRKKNNVNSN